jgi:hypothetical protein
MKLIKTGLISIYKKAAEEFLVLLPLFTFYTF